MARNVLDMLSEWGPEDEEIDLSVIGASASPPSALPEEEPLSPPPLVNAAPPAAGRAPPRSRPAAAPPPEQARPVVDADLRRAQAKDRRNAASDSASDALYAAFSRTPLQNRTSTPSEVTAYVQRQGAADKARQQSERTVDRAAIAKALGVDPSQLDGLSDAGLEKIVGVKVGERQRAATLESAKAKAAADADAEVRKRERELADRADGRGYDAQKEGDRRAWQEEQNRLGRAAQIQAAREGRSERADAKHDDDVRSSLEKYGEKVAAPAEEFLEQRANVEALLTKHKGKDIPGVGPLDNLGVVPDGLRSQDGLDLRKYAGQMMAAYQKLITGSGASDSERANLNKIGADLNSEKGFEAGLKALGAAFDAKIRSLEASYEPDVPTTYRSRNPASRLPKMGAGAPAPQQVRMVSPDGKPFTVDASEAEEAERNGWKRVK